MRRIGITTQNRRIHSGSVTSRFAKRSTTVVLIALVGIGVLALLSRTGVVRSRTFNTVQAVGRGKPYFNFRDGQQLNVNYRGEQTVVEALRSGQAQPRALASIVLAGDATPDLIAGYAWNGMGIVTVQRGNPEAFAPKDESGFARMQQGYNPDSLLPGADTFQVPEAVDFLQVGDFNHDNRKDVLVAARGGDLFLLAGDGRGGLKAPEQISLPGAVTAMTAGEFRALDGWTDTAVGVDGSSGPALLIFDGADGLSGEPVRFRLSAPATAVQIAGLDGDSFQDLAVAAGSEVDIIHGWGRKQEVDPQSRVQRISLNNNARDLAVGFFLWNRAGSNQIAVLSDDGSVNILDQAGSDTRPFSDKELALFRDARRHAQGVANVDVESLKGWQPERVTAWTSAREYGTSSSVAADAISHSVLLKSHISFHETDDLITLDGSQHKLSIVRQDDSKAGMQGQSLSAAGDLTNVSLDVAAAPTAVLALPQKLNGERSLVVMQAQNASPTIVPLAPNAVISVDRIDDPSGGSLAAASACTAAGNDCSLRGAVQFANANAGSTINIPAGTYTLATNGTNAGGCDGNTVGDLGVNTATTISGAGSGTTIIRQHSTGNANNGDRVMCMNEGFTLNLNYSFSGITVVGGRDLGTNVGGGGIIGGEKGNTLTLTDVTIANNQVTGGNIGGGGIQITGGDLTITNCLIGGTSAPGVATDRDTVTSANTNATSTGGGLYFTPSAPRHTASTGNLVVTGTTFNHNTAFGTGGGGAELEILAFALPGGIGTGTAKFDTSTFTNNQATNGGGLQTTTLATTIGSVAGTVSFTSNAATGSPGYGGGVFVGAATLLLDGSTATINFAGNNTATTGGSSIGTNGDVTVAGTNTTIGGDASVFTTGTWTNNNGSAISPTNFSVLGGTLTCNNSTMNVGGNFVLNHETTKGGILNANSATINIKGNLNVDLNNGGSGAVGQFNGGTSTFNFNGTSAQSITNSASITFNNLTDSNTTQPLTCNNSFVVNTGTLNVSGANAILAPVAGAVLSGTGTLTGTGTARVTRTAALADFNNQYLINTKVLTNLTVEYIGAAAQSVSAITYGPLKISNASGATLGGAVTVNGTLTLNTGALGVGTNTLTINNGTSVTSGTLTSGATGTVNYNQGSNGQNVLTANYGNLTFSGFTKVLPSATVGVAGTFTSPVTTGHTITGNTFDFNGTGAQTVPVFNYNNLTISGARTSNSVTLVNGGTIGVAGVFSPTATFSTGNYIIANNTMDFNGSGAQTVPVFNYNNLTISGNRGGAAITLAGGNIGIAGTFSPAATNNTYTTAGNTVIFNGTSTQTVPAFSFGGFTLNNATGANLSGDVTVNATLTLSTGTLGVLANTLTLNGTVTAPGGTLSSGTTGTVNYNQQSNGQATVLAINYGNLTFSNFSKTLASSGTIGIAGTFTPGTGVGHTITGSTIDFNGAGSQTIPGFTYNNLTSSSGAAPRTLDSVNTIKIAGAFTPGANAYTITGSTIEYNGSAVQTLPPSFTTYNNLTLNNAAGTTGFAGLTVNGLIEVKAGTFTSSSTYNNVQIDSGATLAATAGSTINVSGNWTNNGTFTPNTGTVVFNGNNNTQTLAGTNSFNNLTINHTGTNGVTASGSTLSVTNLLRIQAGTFTSSSTFNNVQIDSGATLASDGGTMNVSGNWTNNGGTFTPNGNTVNFNGGAAQTINGTAPSQTFNNFIVNKSNVLSVSGFTTSLTVNNLTITTGTFNAPATLDINGNALLSAGQLTAGISITAAGNWTNNGATFSASGGTVTFDGAGAQAIGGTIPTPFNNLTIANAGTGVSLTQNETVNGTLTLTNDLTTGASTLTQPGTAPASAGTGDVIGNVTRTGAPLPTGTTLTFGNPFVSLNFAVAGTTPTSVNFNLAKNVPGSPMGFPNAVKRTYTITPTGGSGYSATLRLHYQSPGDLNGNDPATMNLWRFDSTLPSPGWRPNPATARDCAAGCTTNNSEFWAERSGVTTFSPWTLSSLPSSPTAANGIVSGRITDGNGAPVSGAVINLSGAQSRKTITNANGDYRFNNVPTNAFYTVTPGRANYSFNPASRSFSQIGSQTEAAFTGIESSDTVNPLDTPEYFVRQQYVDILGREPDEAGFNYWTDQILACGEDVACGRAQRTGVAAAFFVENEFKQSGAFIYNVYKGALSRRPNYSEYSADRHDVVGGPSLEAQKQAFAAAFVARAEFVSKYEGNDTAESFVDALLSNVQASGIDLSSQREGLIGRYNTGGSQAESRAFVLRDITESAAVRDGNYNAAFVLVEYFGYLHRNPDQNGYDFWLNVLNETGRNGDPASYRGMVCSFITSAEYQRRFSVVVSRSNSECGQ